MRTRFWIIAACLVAAVPACGATSSQRSATSSAASATGADSAATPVATPTSASVPATTSASPSVHTPTATRPSIPPLSAAARKAGLLDIRTIIPDAVVDLRYRTSDNFVGVRLYPVGARCLVQRSMRAGLITAAARLRHAGLVLVFWDCYRPHAVQVRMFRIVPNPDWVARPGRYATSHEAGRSVDVTLARAAVTRTCESATRVEGHCLLSMGTKFDDFTARAHAFATEGVSAAARANRTLLRRAMNAGGIVVYAGEWWHFDGPGAGIPRPQLDAPLG